MRIQYSGCSTFIAIALAACGSPSHHSGSAPAATPASISSPINASAAVCNELNSRVPSLTDALQARLAAAEVGPVRTDMTLGKIGAKDVTGWYAQATAAGDRQLAKVLLKLSADLLVAGSPLAAQTGSQLSLSELSRASSPCAAAG